MHILRVATLQTWMTKNGLRDRQLAEQAGGITRSQISRIRRGARTSPATAKRLAEITGLPAATFIFGDEGAGAASGAPTEAEAHA